MASPAPNSEGVSPKLLQKLYPVSRAWQVWKRAPEEPQLEALAIIRTQRLISALPYLPGLFATGSEQVRTSTAETIAILFVDPDQGTSLLSPGLNRLLGYEQLVEIDALNQIKRETIWSLKVPAEFEWAVFGLLSFHSNGWIREAALDRLVKLEDGREIPFLLHRSTDWVPVIAEKAAAGLRSRLASRPVRQFTATLSILYRLRARQRGLLNDFQTDMLHRICLEEDFHHILAFADGIKGRGIRRWVSGLITSIVQQRPEAEALVRRLRKDPDPLVRIAAWNFFWSTSASEADLLDGLGDSWAAIRRQCLEKLCATLNESRRRLLMATLFDGSGMVRATARYFLEKLGSTDVAAVYREKLQAPSAASPAAIFGLSETGTKEDADLLSGYLQQAKVSLRKAAIIAIGHLDAERYATEIKSSLFDTSPGVRKAAREVLARHRSLISSRLVMELLGRDKSLAVRKSGIMLIKSLQKWEQILAFLEVLRDAPEFKDFVIDEVGRWLSTYNRSWVAPQPDQLARLGVLINRNARMLAPGIVRQLQHIAGSSRSASE